MTRCRVQYFYWLGNALQGDLGTSLRTQEPVTQLIASKLPVTHGAGVAGDDHRAGDRHQHGDFAAVRKNTLGRSRSQRCRAVGDLDSALLAGDPADPAVLGAICSGCPPRATCRSVRIRLQNLKTLLLPAFVLGTGLCGDADAPHPRVDDCGVESGLHPHGTR